MRILRKKEYQKQSVFWLKNIAYLIQENLTFSYKKHIQIHSLSYLRSFSFLAPETKRAIGARYSLEFRPQLVHVALNNRRFVSILRLL